MAVALLAEGLVNRRMMLCCVEFETTLTDLMSPCESCCDCFGRFGIEYDHLQSLGLIES